MQQVFLRVVRAVLGFMIPAILMHFGSVLGVFLDLDPTVMSSLLDLSEFLQPLLAAVSLWQGMLSFGR